MPDRSGPPTSPQGRHRAVVVGGGIAGLLAAESLVEAGLEVTLLEAGARLGGLVHSETRDGLVLENGPDAILASKPAGPRLLERLGLGDRVVENAPGGAAILHGGRLHPIPGNTVLGIPTSLRAMGRSSLFGWGDVARMAVDLVARPRRSAGDVSVGELVRRRLGSAAVDRLVGPLLAGISGGDVDDLSAEAAFPQLLAFEREHGSLIRGGRAAARQRVGRAPFLSLRGGMGELVDAIVARLGGATIRSGEPVASIRRTGDGFSIQTDLAAHEADVVIVATPPRVAAGLLSGICRPAADGLCALESRSTAVVHLWFADPGDPRPSLGHGFLVAAGERRAITGLTDVSAKWPHRAPVGTTLLRAYVAGRVLEAGRHSDADVLTAVLADVRDITGLRGDPALTVVRHLPDAMPQPHVGHLARIAGIRRELDRAAGGGILLVGGAYDGVGIPSIADGVERQVRTVLDVPSA